jgi:osmotically-inducible protein OsmY
MVFSAPAAMRLLLVVGPSMFLIDACNRPSVEREAPAAADEVRPTDATLETTVRAELYTERTGRGGDVDVRVNDGVVTLQGTVDTAEARQRAIEAARRVDGVVRVDEQLNVAPEAPAADRAGAGQSPTPATGSTVSPAWVTTKIQAQYFVDPDIKPWNIDVTTTSDGVVELRGQVETAEAKADAVRIARATEGVSSVTDRLTLGTDRAPAADVGTDLATSDAWVTAKIRAKYFLDDDVKAMNVEVATQDGVVTLTGAVETDSARRQAVALARNTDGVRTVEDQLRVAQSDAPGDARGTSGTGVAAAIEDSWITTRLQAKYFLEDEIKGRNIDVDTRNGVVTLTGTVNSPAERALAEQLARDTDGVARVTNRLTVMAAP